MHGTKPLKALVTGIGSPGARGVIHSLRKAADSGIQILGVDADKEAIGAIWSDEFAVIPRADSRDFPAAIVKLCKTHQVDVLLSLVTRELPVLAGMQDELAKLGVRMALSTPQTLDVANDKGQMLEFLRDSGVPVPDFRIAKRPGELLQAVDELASLHGSVCFKPIHGDGSRGFRVIHQHAPGAQELFSSKPDSALHISRGELVDILSKAESIPDLVIMEYLPGEEYSVDTLARQGETLIAVVRLRKKVVGGITTEGEIVCDPEVTGYVKQVIQKFGFHGNIGVQVRRNKQGAVRILEINPRLQGTTIHATAAGVNLPWLGVKLALGEEISPDLLQFQAGTRVVRHWDEVFFDANGHAFTL